MTKIQFCHAIRLYTNQNFKKKNEKKNIDEAMAQGKRCKRSIFQLLLEFDGKGIHYRLRFVFGMDQNSFYFQNGAASKKLHLLSHFFSMLSFLLLNVSF